MSKIKSIIETQIQNAIEVNTKATTNEASYNSNQQFVFDSWNGLKNRTNVFETIPLVYALFDEKNVTAQMMLSVLNKRYDWNPKGQEWLVNILRKIENDPAAFQTFIEVVVKHIMDPTKSSLKDINGGKKIDGFIHGRIKTFYSLLEKNSRLQKHSKNFTADVILIWGKATAYNIIKPESGLTRNMKVNGDSLLTLSDGATQIACVSLKALKGRLGKATTLFTSRFGEEVVNEGVLDTIKSKLKSVGSFASEVYAKLKNAVSVFTTWVANTTKTIKSIFNPKNPIVAKYQSKNETEVREADRLLQLFDEMAKETENESVTSLREAQTNSPVQITTCFRDEMRRWYMRIQKDVDHINSVFTNFIQTVDQTQNSSIFRVHFKSIDEQGEDYLREINNIKTFIQKLSKSTVGEEDGPNKYGKFSSQKSCFRLYVDGKPLQATKPEIRTILMTNANALSVGILNNMINAFMTSIDKKNTIDATQKLIQFTTELNAEAIFGRILDVPLIKYDGRNITRFGTRLDFENNQIKKMVTAFKSDLNLPVVGIDITPTTKGYSSGASYYDIVLYALTDYTQNNQSITSPQNFMYSTFTFTCNSGTEFRFSIEGEDVITGADVLKIISA